MTCLRPHSRHAAVRGGPAAGDPAPRRPGVRCADRRTAVPARGCGDCRASRASRSSRASGSASAVLHTVVGLMVFLAYSTTPAVARAIGNGQLPKALAAGRDGVWLALLLGVVLAYRRFPGRRTARRPHGCQRRGAGLRRGLPALVNARTRRDAADLRRHRGAARPAGHTHPAACSGRRLHAERRAEPLPGLRAAVVRRRLGDRHQHRPVGHGPGLRGDGPAQCPPPRCGPAAGLARHPVTEQSGLVADAADAQPAHCDPCHGGGGHGPGAGQPGRPPARDDDLHLPGVRPRCPRDCRAGADRQGTRRLPPVRGAGAHRNHGPLGPRLRRDHRTPAGASRRRGRGGSSRPTPTSRPRSRWRCGCSRPDSRSPAMFLSSTAC